MKRALGTIALVLLLALVVFASAADAQPLSMKFSEARANVGASQLIDAPLFEPPSTAPFQAQIDPGSGSITAGVLGVPEFSTFITDPVDADVAVDFEIGIITGSFDMATGALTLEGEAGGTLTANGSSCIVTTDPPVLIVSTGEAKGAIPHDGVPFTAGLAGPGAIAGEWTDMHAAPVTPDDAGVCEVVEDHIEGPGGVWLKQEGVFVPPLGPRPPAAPACVVPKLVGKRLAAAKAALRAASCKLGKVRKPSRRQGRARWVLVVRSSSPSVGASPADGRVDLRLRSKPRKARR